MPEPLCERILEKYMAYLSANVTVREEGDHCRLLTPFLLPDNTQLSVCLERASDDRVIVTDYGDTDADLFLHGLNVDPRDPRRKQIANRFGVSNQGGELSLVTTVDESAEAITRVVHAIYDTAYLVYLHRPRKQRTFSAEVQQFLADHSTLYVTRPKVDGISGQQEFDLSIHRGGKAPWLTDTISTADHDTAKRNAKLLVYKKQEVDAAAPQTYRYLCLLDDRSEETKNALDAGVTAPFESWGIQYVRWSRRDDAEALAA